MYMTVDLADIQSGSLVGLDKANFTSCRNQMYFDFIVIIHEFCKYNVDYSYIVITKQRVC